MTASRYLIIQTAFLGDVVLALPMAAYIKQKDSDAKVDMVVRPDAVPIAEACPDVNHVYSFDKRGKNRGWFGIVRMAKHLRRKSYTAVFTPQRFLRSTLLSHATRIPNRYGFDKNVFPWLYTQKVPYQQRVHEIGRNLSLVRAHWHELSREYILPRLTVEKVKSKTITIAPGAVWYTKRWPVHKWIALIEHSDMQKHPICLIGGPCDKAVANEIMQAVTHPRIENRVGKDALHETFKQIAGSRLLISNDSAPQHFAMAVRTPVITIFGSTIPAFGFAPIGEKDQYIETPVHLQCRPCGIHGKKKCPAHNFACMESISVEAVVDKIRKLETHGVKQRAHK